ncbi:MAG: hypothetical protein V1743_01045 [Nanoarchaeota archaeon]
MSIRDIIKKELADNTGISYVMQSYGLVDGHPVFCTPVKGLFSTRSVVSSYLIAPKSGIYTAEGLNEFMTGLIIQVQPNKTLEFSEEQGNLTYGHLEFSCILGTETVTVTREPQFVAREEMWKRGWSESMTTCTLDLVIVNQILICPFPNEHIRYEISIGAMSSSRIDRNTLERFKHAAVA